MLPDRIARRFPSQLTIQPMGSETLVYDQSRHLAFCLNPVASAVWKRCETTLSAQQIADQASAELQLPIGLEAVELAMAQLVRDGLLVIDEEAGVPIAVVAAAGVSRRSMLARMGATATLAVPVIAMIAAPKAAQAYNGCVDCLTEPSHESGQSSQGATGSGDAAPQSGHPQLYNDDLK